MPVVREPISRSQLAEFLAVDPERLIAIEKVNSSTFALVLEPEMQTKGTFPQLNTSGKKITTGKKGGKGGKRSC